MCDTWYVTLSQSEHLKTSLRSVRIVVFDEPRQMRPAAKVELEFIQNCFQIVVHKKLSSKHKS